MAPFLLVLFLCVLDASAAAACARRQASGGNPDEHDAADEDEDIDGAAAKEFLRSVVGNRLDSLALGVSLGALFGFGASWWLQRYTSTPLVFPDPALEQVFVERQFSSSLAVLLRGSIATFVLFMLSSVAAFSLEEDNRPWLCEGLCGLLGSIPCILLVWWAMREPCREYARLTLGRVVAAANIATRGLALILDYDAGTMSSRFLAATSPALGTVALVLGFTFPHMLSTFYLRLAMVAPRYRAIFMAAIMVWVLMHKSEVTPIWRSLSALAVATGLLIGEFAGFEVVLIQQRAFLRADEAAAELLPASSSLSSDSSASQLKKGGEPDMLSGHSEIACQVEQMRLFFHKQFADRQFQTSLNVLENAVYAAVALAVLHSAIYSVVVTTSVGTFLISGTFLIGNGVIWVMLRGLRGLPTKRARLVHGCSISGLILVREISIILLGSEGYDSIPVFALGIHVLTFGMFAFCHCFAMVEPLYRWSGFLFVLSSVAFQKNEVTYSDGTAAPSSTQALAMGAGHIIGELVGGIVLHIESNFSPPPPSSSLPAPTRAHSA